MVVLHMVLLIVELSLGDGCRSLGIQVALKFSMTFEEQRGVRVLLVRIVDDLPLLLHIVNHISESSRGMVAYP